MILPLKVVPIFLLLIHNNNVFGLREYSKQDLNNLQQQVKEVFYHAYNGYLNHAFPYDELRPLSCDGIDTWGSYSLTLIDALDTLVIMGNYTEFARVVQLITERANFDININVSLFETNIRIVGGLLSAHLFSERAGLKLDPGWPCNGPLLRLAEDVARRLLPAFDTDTGMPFGTVNLRYGVPTGETPVTCTAGVGTYIVEFGTLSRLTGDPIYEEVALRALRSLFKRKSNIGLFGNHIDTKTGIWTAQDSGIGAGVDSYFEYLVKGAILFQRPELQAMFNEIRGPIDKYLKRDDWYLWVSMHKGQVTLPVFQSLEAFWPGVLSLVGDVSGAMKSLHNYHQVWKQYGFLPEFYNIVNSEASTNRESYPLRPELIESAMYLYRATGDPYLLDVGQDILNSIQHSARTPCGYATIKNVVDHSQEDHMESFFLAETTKYLYLLFDTENFIHNDGNQGKVFVTDAGKMCVLGAGGYIFNTEAHPVDVSALQCCSSEKLGDLNLELTKPKQKMVYNREPEDTENTRMETELETKVEADGNEILKDTQKTINDDFNAANREVNPIEREIDNELSQDAIRELNEINRHTNNKVKIMEVISEEVGQGMDAPSPPSGPSPPSQEAKGRVETSFETNYKMFADEIVHKLETAVDKFLFKDKFLSENKRRKESKREDFSLLETIEQRVVELGEKKEDAKDTETQTSDSKNGDQNIETNKSRIQNFDVDNKVDVFSGKDHQTESLDELDRKSSKVGQSNRVSTDELISERIHLIKSEYAHLDNLDRDTLYRVLKEGGAKLRLNQKKLDAAMLEELLEVKTEMMKSEEDFFTRLENLEGLQAKLDSMREAHSRILEINDHMASLLKSVLAKQYEEADKLSPEQSQLRVNAIEVEMKRTIASQRNFDIDQLETTHFSELSDTKITVNSSILSDENDTEDSNPVTGNITRLNLPSGAYAIINHTMLSELSKPSEKTYSEQEMGVDNDTDEAQEVDPCAGLTLEPLRLCQLARNPPPVFHPQALYAKVLSQTGVYTMPGIWDAHYSLLTCAPQPFFTKFSLRGEFFEPAS